ncbi:MAG: hypothetical protein ACRDDY_14995 [Clostridium sp.]|uniref:hypothetical protein n=1 Tax=Clostridium sp. TaxID=1506 RepID=UPI003EE7520C
MARNRVKLGSMAKQIQDRLDSKIAMGESKHKAKKDGTANKKIFAWDTYKNYMKHTHYFTDYCKKKYDVKTLDECKKYVPEYLQNCIDRGLTASTQKAYASALAKIYGCKTTDFGIKTNVRHRVDITRSRGPKDRDKHFSEVKNKELVEFCKSTGLRRNELKYITGDKLYKNNEGKYMINVTIGTKGGRERDVPVIGNIENVVKLMNSAGSNRVFNKISTAADIHSYRSNYATSYYKSIARDIKDIPFDKVNKGTGHAYQSAVYVCKADMKGIKFDKVAMAEVSKALGHNRISVIAGHYLRDIEEVEE